MREVFVNSPFTIMHRLEIDVVNATKAMVSAISWKAVNQVGGATAASGSIAVSTGVYDELQHDGIWSKDATGYNLIHHVGNDVLTVAGVYLFAYTITPVGGQAFVSPRVVQVKANAAL